MGKNERKPIAAEAGGIAAVRNVALCMETLELLINREPHLPGMGAFYGYSGLGKSLASTYAAVHYRAYFVEARSAWTRKALLLALLKEMGIKPATTVYDMSDQVSEQLALSGRPLIIDEVDYLVKNSTIELIRDVYEASGGAPILLVGEENLEKSMRPWERVHNRILKWQPAQPASLADVRELAGLYSPDVLIADDLLELILKVSRNITRRACVNISYVHRHALNEGLERIGLDEWGTRPLDSGEAPRRA